MTEIRYLKMANVGNDVQVRFMRGETANVARDGLNDVNTSPSDEQ